MPHTSHHSSSRRRRRWRSLRIGLILGLICSAVMALMMYGIYLATKF